MDQAEETNPDGPAPNVLLRMATAQRTAGCGPTTEGDALNPALRDANGISQLLPPK